MCLKKSVGGVRKKFRERAKILGVGLKGPNKFSMEEQLDRTGRLKINVCSNVFYTSCRLVGLRNPNKLVIIKKANGEYLCLVERTTTVNQIYRNMCVEGDNTVTGTEGRPLRQSSQSVARETWVA